MYSEDFFILKNSLNMFMLRTEGSSVVRVDIWRITFCKHLFFLEKCTKRLDLY